MNDSALEARADREGARAARGMSVTQGYGGATAALSNASAASASGPMQAKSGRNKPVDEGAAPPVGMKRPITQQFVFNGNRKKVIKPPKNYKGKKKRKS